MAVSDLIIICLIHLLTIAIADVGGPLIAGAADVLPQQRTKSSSRTERSGERKLLLSTVYVSTAADFVAAIADQRVELVRVSTSPLVIPPSAWKASGSPVPMLISRDLTIEGDPALADWPTLDFMEAKAKMRMAGHATLKIRHVLYLRIRGNPTRAPDLDILAPTPPGALSTMLIGPAAGTFGICFPAEIQRVDFSMLQQRPPQFPGSANRVDVGLPQDGCLNSTVAPPLKRCWAGKIFIVDFASYGGVQDEVTDAVLPNNVVFNIRNSTVFCETNVDEQCLLKREPLVCYKEAERRFEQLRAASAEDAVADNATSSSSLGGAAALATAGGPPTASVYGGDPASGGMGSGSWPPGIIGATVAGVLVLLAAATAMVVVVRVRRRRRRAYGGVPPAAAAAEVGSGAAGEVGRASPDDQNCAYKTALSAGGGRKVAPAAAANDDALLGPLAAVEGVSGVGKGPHATKWTQNAVGGGGEGDLTLDLQDPTAHFAADSAPVGSDAARGKAACGVDEGVLIINESIAVTDPSPPHKTPPPPAPSLTTVVVTPLTPPRADVSLDIKLLDTSPIPPDGCNQLHQPPQQPNSPPLQPPEMPSLQQTQNHQLPPRSDQLHPVMQPCTCQPAEECEECSAGIHRKILDLEDKECLTQKNNDNNCLDHEHNTQKGNSSSKPPVVKLLPELLGRGSFGRVVVGMFCGRRVAVKLMAGGEGLWDQAGGDDGGRNQPRLSSSVVGVDAFARSFVREVEVLSRVQHPNVVQLLAACVTPPRLCLVMELMETSLEGLMYGKRRSRDGACDEAPPPPKERLPLEKVLHIGISITSALAYLHPTIVHRDLKPANVLLNDAESDRPIVKLTDFGLSRLRVTVATTQNPDAGTPPYMAPECFDLQSARITHQSDIYSLGVLLWEMLAGSRPWHGVGQVAVALMVAYQGRRLPLTIFDDSRCPPKLARLLESCWDADPARRPAAAEAAKQMAMMLMELKLERTLQPHASAAAAADAASAAVTTAADAGRRPSIQFCV